MRELTFEEVHRFCRQRPVELELAPCEQRGTIVLHADFEGHGDFFSIRAEDVEYMQLAGRSWVGGVVLADWRQLSEAEPFWATLQSEYSGPALAMWSSDAKSLAEASSKERFVIVARRFVFWAGSDWET